MPHTMPGMDAQDIRAARGVAGTAARSVPGWILGSGLLLIGALLCVWMGGDVRAEAASSPHQGTFTVRSCRVPAAGGDYVCRGAFAPETGGGDAHGTLRTGQRLAAGRQVRVEDSSADFTRNTYQQIPGNRLGGNVLVLGLAVAAVAGGLFALLTGYSPRPFYAGFGRWTDAHQDRRRVTFTEAWHRLPARAVLVPVLGVLAGLGVLTAAAW
jgi:hypothetical protein